VSDDEKIGARTRDLLRAFSDFADMVAVEAPTPVLVRQLDEVEKVFRDVDQLAGTQLYDSSVWGIVGDPVKLMRLYEVLQHRQAQKSPSE
jgi:hypothetical protein